MKGQLNIRVILVILSPQLTVKLPEKSDNNIFIEAKVKQSVLQGEKSNIKP